tara:strand:- start:987 stop:1319 length:333 start_codon:yes stop_codon:yes gene_type:complete
MIYVLIGILLILLITSKKTVEAFEDVDDDKTDGHELQAYIKIDESNKSVYKNKLVDGIMVVSIVVLSAILIYVIVQKVSKNKRFKLSKINVSYEKALKAINKKKIIKTKK